MGNISIEAAVLFQKLLPNLVDFIDDGVVMHLVAPR